MELTRREKTALITSIVCIGFMIVLIFTMDLFMQMLFPTVHTGDWSFFNYILIFLIIVNGLYIVWIVKPRKLTPHIVDSSEIQEGEINEELMNVGIVPSGQIIEIIEKVAYCDPVYARKRFRAWPWRAKGKIIVTNKELIFVSVKKKKINFSILISEIYAIQPFVARGGSRSFKVCEIIYKDQFDNEKVSALFMGRIGFSTFDYPSEIELKSMKLMEKLQKWYDTWVED